MFTDEKDDLGNVAIAVCMFVLLLAGAVYFFNRDAAPVQTAFQAPTIDRTVPNIVPNLPRLRGVASKSPIVPAKAGTQRSG
jgi:hypothetical protein